MKVMELRYGTSTISYVGSIIEEHQFNPWDQKSGQIKDPYKEEDNS